MSKSAEFDIKPITPTSTKEVHDEINPIIKNDQERERKYFESDAGDGTKSTDHHLTGFPLYSCLLSCLLCLFLTALDQTIIVTILETVGNKFGQFEQIGWLSSGFLLTTCVFQTLWGKISLIFGRKWVFLSGVVIFEIGSLICALANSMSMLIVGRVIAGIGGGCIQSLNSIVITEVVKISHRSVANSLIGVVFGISSILGPLIGGAFTKRLSWRWCFYINLPIGGLCILMMSLLFHPPQPKLEKLRTKLKKIDYLGIFLITIGLTFILLSLSFGGVEYHWNSAIVIVFFLIGVISVILYNIWNFIFCPQEISIIPKEIVKIYQIDAASLALGFSFFYYIGIILYLGVYLQVVIGYDALKSGIALLPMVISVITCSILSGFLLKWTRYVKPFALFGAILSPIGCGILSLLTRHSSVGMRIGIMIPVGISMGLQFQTRVLEAQLVAPKTPGGLILTTSFVNFGRTLGGTLGAELCQTVFNTSFKNSIRVFEKDLNLTSAEALALISFPERIKSLSLEHQDLVYKCVMKSLHNVFYTCTGSASISLILSFFTTNKRIPQNVATKSESAENK